MKTNMVTPHLELMCIVDILIEELNAYKNSKNVSQFIVNKREKLIVDLNRVLDNIVHLNADNVCVDLYNEINRLRNLDNTIDSFSVLIRDEEVVKNTAVINIQNFVK